MEVVFVIFNKFSGEVIDCFEFEDECERCFKKLPKEDRLCCDYRGIVIRYDVTKEDIEDYFRNYRLTSGEV